MKYFSIIFVVVMLFAEVSISFAQINWTRQNGGDPVLDPGPSGAWDDEFAGGPSILFDGNIYHMWYFGRNGIQRIGYAWSSDGISWQKYNDPNTTDSLFAESDPVLNPGDPGEWDDEQATAPSVILIDNSYHMWYRGRDLPGGASPASIGHATSNDGIRWEKDTLNNPVLSPGPPGRWDAGWIGYPSIVFDGTNYHMWYSASDGFSTHIQIGHATTSHPDSAWIKDLYNPVLSYGISVSWDYPRVDHPNVIYDGNIFHMWYSGGEVFAWKIGYATLSHPDSNWIKFPNFVLNLGEPGSWEDTWVGACSVIPDNTNSIYKMWYTGGNAVWDGHIGYATAPVVGIKVLDVNLPNDYMLHQNYPNPFNPTTNIQFSIPKSEFVTLKIYNILGEEVVTLVSERLTAGSYKYDWDASGLASGVYLYSIKAGDHVDSKKMILLR